MKLRPLLLIRQSTVVLLSLSFFAPSAFCQDKFAAIPDEIAPQYHFDFARNFFASPEVEKSERSNYYAALGELESLKGKVAASADHLLRALQLYDDVKVQFLRHYTYLYLRYAVNTKDKLNSSDSSALDAEFAKRTAFLHLELLQISEQALTGFIKQKAALKPYLFAIESVRRYRPHTLSLKEEELLSSTIPSTSEWQYDLYQNLIARTPFGTVPTKDGELNVLRQRTVIANNPDRTVREAGFKKLYKGYASQRDLYAFTLIRLVETRNHLAKLHHYQDAPSEVYFNSYWSKAEVADLLERVARLADVYKRYQRLRADYVKKNTGYTDVNIWDMSAGLIGQGLPRFTIDQASRLIREVVSPLGSGYGRELALLLDPANGRMDIVPGRDRKSSSFSKGFPGVTTVFFSTGFAGYYNDVRVLAHESTHAVHRQLMKNNHVLPAYAEGPHYMFESFAIFNELLLPDYLYQHETDPQRKRYFLEQFFEGKGMELFYAAEDAALEQAIYDGVEHGSIKNADDLDALTKRINSQYSIWSDKHDELKMRWITSSLMFEDPLYLINYLYGALLALKYYEMFTRDPQHFVPRYVALIQNGFNAPPAVLLKRFLDIDLRNPHILTEEVKLLESKVNNLEGEYSK